MHRQTPRPNKTSTIPGIAEAETTRPVHNRSLAPGFKDRAAKPKRRWCHGSLSTSKHRNRPQGRTNQRSGSSEQGLANQRSGSEKAQHQYSACEATWEQRQCITSNERHNLNRKRIRTADSHRRSSSSAGSQPQEKNSDDVLLLAANEPMLQQRVRRPRCASALAAPALRWAPSRGR